MNNNNIERLIKEGRIYASKNDFNGAKNKFSQVAELFALAKDSKKQNWALAAAAYMSILNKDIAEGLSLFNKAAKLGYTDLEKLDDLSNLKYKGRGLKELNTFQHIYKLVYNNASTIGIVKYQSQNIEPWQWMKYCDTRNLVRLKKKLPHFKSTKEFDFFKECLAWVNKCFAHDAVNKPSNSNPITILKEADDKRGFTCQEFSILLAAVMQAQGYPARVIAILKNNYGYGTGKGHWVIEVWSDDFDKWILLDPQNNCYWMAGKEVLNASEIREYVLKGKTQQVNPYINGRKAVSLKSWLEYFSVVWIYNNQNFFANWDTLGETEETSDRPHLLFQDKPRGYFKHHQGMDYLYPSMNKISYKLKYHNKKLSFVLSNSCPFFKKYEISRNNGPWSECKSEFVGHLTKGSNIFTFRVRDIFNRKTKNVVLAINKYK
ncbi:MAG: transglutaminase-like domain-containing protein [Candidatus Edwardsbacteria bacterium]|nr:transglutaminase-like domain-containing protein [Candidatus Edwardsbacteria bacterium]MBU1575894.1 transglutaminase-like domain-containing protein [Candidatus Edwardsbacteria bacterium]MBU2593107.1 transglutaminase-like domain-containing protein [Candidatus Edwardsbacteria bacterium]